MSLADYLAKNYLTADSEKKSKKRKRKNKDAGLVIDDDDDLAGWKKGAESDDDDAPTIGMAFPFHSTPLTRYVYMSTVLTKNTVGSTAGLSLAGTSTNPSTSTTSKSKKKKSSRSTTTTATPWTTIGAPAPSTAAQIAADAAAADAIIASTEADRRKASAAEDAAPTTLDPEGVLKMESGAAAGLQTAAEVAAQMRAKEDEEARKAAEVARENPGETIYRDASGRVINVAMKRAEARRKAEEEERKKREKEVAARGDVQNAEAARRREALREAKTLTVARYADDRELNEELREQGRWNDPAMGFLKKKKKGRSITGKPLYQGAFAPNRYGIRPGHRWDGVDRGNGFEAEWFKSRNRKADLQRMEYAWQMDE
jgi:pre-mRNA-splicing factor CWC26